MNKAIENENKLVAQRYAQAILALSDNKSQILSELLDITNSYLASSDFQRVMSSPVISISEKKKVLENLFQKTTSNTVLNFLNVLVDKNRFSLLHSITKECQNEINKLNNLLNMTVTSAINLTDNDKAMIKTKLENVLNKKIDLEWNVNSDIIAGLVFEAGDNIVDNSLRHKLQELSRKMTK